MVDELLFMFPHIIQIILLLILPLTNDLCPLNPFFQSHSKILLKSNYSWNRIYSNSVRFNKENLDFLLPSTYKMFSVTLMREIWACEIPTIFGNYVGMWSLLGSLQKMQWKWVSPSHWHCEIRRINKIHRNSNNLCLEEIFLRKDGAKQ